METIKRTTKKIGHFMMGVIIAMTSIFMTGCEKNRIDNETYEVRFAINAMSVEKPDNGLKSAINLSDYFMLKSLNPNDVTHIRIGIDGTHEVPQISQTLPYRISDGVTEPIKLSVGDHILTSMTLLRETSPGVYEVMYSAVNAGAELAQYVAITLPITFHIPLLNQIAVSVDVVALDEWTPEQFGWAIFNIGFTSVNPIYFYGATDDGQPSTMEMKVYDGGELISTSTQEIEGWIKVLYPDAYEINNSVESYTFVLNKDGKQYTQTYSVEQLLSLPREVILLNVYGSGMAGFQEVLTLTSVMFSMPNTFASGGGERFGFTVRNSMGLIVYQSNVTQGEKTFTYQNTSTPDNSEMYTITMSYQLWNNGPGDWNPLQTRVANVSVSTLMAMSSPISMGIYSDNYYWLFE